MEIDEMHELLEYEGINPRSFWDWFLGGDRPPHLEVNVLREAIALFRIDGWKGDD